MKNEAFILDVAARADLKRSLKEIYSVWPNLRDITIRLAEFMPEIIPAEDKNTSLLQRCISNAVEQFRSVPANHFGNEFQMVAYIRGLVEFAPQFAKISVVSMGSDPELWEPFTETISDFTQRFSGKIDIAYHPQTLASDESLRLMILSRIISTRDLQWIDETLSLPAMLKEAA